MATAFDLDLGISQDATYSIAGKSIKFDSVEDIEPFLKQMDAYATLKKIDFSGNTIGVEASKALAESIEKAKDSLVDVNFADFFTGRLKDEIPRSLEYILPALLKCPYLRVLNLSDNAFGLQTIDPIESFLERVVALEHLILSNNGMGPFAGARIGKALYKLAAAKAKDSKAPQSLKTFYCGRNRLENGSVNYLAIGLKAHKGLESIRLYQNGIRPAGIYKLFDQGLKYNKFLKVVDLQDNTFTTQGSLALAAALESWTELVELNLNDCLLKPKGSLAVVKAFAESGSKPNLTTLKLQYNELDEESLPLLVEVVKSRLPNLKILELNGNKFAEDTDEIDSITAIFEERGFGELDELDELEEPDSDEEDEDESEEEDEQDDGVILEDLEKELKQDKDVEKLVLELEETHM
ncbi:unnamed protein product [Kuraishia capsulata CBS 1993]|uniref:Ran GTPase-activating protein 1 n=1 Tax=Kuraishia capsulata CBS 1993 TaxID=1382522 RepID=W6MGH8_9ASCO|nr:uncharacterized protein KUCA_T00000878001 [Kuraishia capsulata CBS 1993]CDK24911.1 unnamed protein product [Kuraishia capsulata CBS 1993]